MTTRYFKREAESELGEGVVLMEIIGEDVVKQVEIYGETLIWCDRLGQSDDRFMLADQPLSVLGLNSDHEITATEFENAWMRAKTTSHAR